MKLRPIVSATPITGWKSEYSADCTAYRPMPGQSNTVSTSTVLPSIQPKRRPMMASVGSIALRSAYTVTMRQRGMPLARAAVM